MQSIKPIRAEADFLRALQEINLCLHADEGSGEGDRLEKLSILVDDYESKHIPIPFPDPIAAIQFILDQRGPRGKSCWMSLAAAVAFPR